jgi:hypothetical protein
MNKTEEELEKLRNQIGIFEGIDLSYISKGGKVKMISWGNDYNKWSVDKRLEFSEALASALNEGLELMQNERNIAMEEVLKLQSQLLKAQENLDIMRETNITAITSFNKEKQDMVKIIRELEVKLDKENKEVFISKVV